MIFETRLRGIDLRVEIDRLRSAWSMQKEEEEHAVRKSRYTEEQIAFAPKQAETGTPVAEVRRMGVSKQTF